MPKIIISVDFDEVVMVEGNKKEAVSVTAKLDDLNKNAPTSADHIACIMREMLPAFIDAASKLYAQKAASQQGLGSDASYSCIGEWVTKH